MAPGEAGYRAGRLFGLTQCGCSLCFSYAVQQQDVGGRECECQEGKTPPDMKMPQACATVHFCKAAGKVCPHICWTGHKALPGRAMPERNMKEKFCLPCRKIDDSENERFSMGCKQTEQISLAAPTFYCNLSLLLQCCLETWISWCSKLEILLRNFFLCLRNLKQ